ncbi:glycosyltransferase family 2 protein [Williamsia sp. CHRR-6]|uniref:glycosyltransferase family 2 protein n=1 Tax=Williamsia sp. CHRR-6 TaxID=2835871 RepID=UPI001BDA1E21|nr:glycosyltransferase family 2 protein [Williamsia sp. CHRR-6]MBT0566962.1 glycosyltransferase family 2 protein [Williamsia sp. CHRR-6]
MSLSVVMPAYNEEAVIGACLDRILRQGDAVAEVIVVDNNSVDRTADIVAAKAAQDPRVRLVEEKRAGVSYARYTGFAAARHDVIVSVDSDTIVGDGWAQAIDHAFAAHPQLTAGTGPMIMHDLPLQGRFARRHARLSARAAARLVTGKLTPLPALSGANSAIRRSAWEQIREKVTYRRDVFEDLDRSLHLRTAGHTITVIPGMDATVSGRRLLSGPRDFLRYAACGPRTYALHGKRVMAAVAWFTSLTAVVRLTILLPLHRAWDPQTRSYSWKRLRTAEVRDSPIAADLE